MNNNTSKNYYAQPEGYILNPFNFIYNEPEFPIQDEALKETLQNVIDIDEERLDTRLDYIEHLVKMDSLAYIRKGCLYATIKFNKLYKKTYSNFDLYAVDKLGSSTRSVVNHIDASRVGLELMMAGFEYIELPANMSAAVVMKEWTGPELIEKWQYVLSELEPHERTATNLKNLLYPPVVKKEEIYTKVELPLSLYSKLMEVCYKASIPMVKGIEAVVNVLSRIKKKTEIAPFMRWLIDYQKLVDEF